VRVMVLKAAWGVGGFSAERSFGVILNDGADR
jgi:hypothetical protein